MGPALRRNYITRTPLSGSVSESSLPGGKEMSHSSSLLTSCRGRGIFNLNPFEQPSCLTKWGLTYKGHSSESQIHHKNQCFIMEIEIPLSPSKVFYSITKGLVIIVPLCVCGGVGDTCSCVNRCICMHMHVKNRGQPYLYYSTFVCWGGDTLFLWYYLSLKMLVFHCLKLLPIRVSGLVSEHWDSADVHLPSTRVTSASHWAQLFVWVLGRNHRSSCL